MGAYYRQNKFWIWIVFIAATINTIRNIGVIVSEDLAHGRSVDWIFYLINEFTGSYTAILLIPLLLFFFAKYPFDRNADGRIYTSVSWLGLYLLVSILFGILHTTLMYGTRLPLYTWAGITRIHEIFNDLPYRYLMEYFKQFLVFWLIYLVYWGVKQYQGFKDQEVNAVRLSKELASAKLQTLQMQLHPHFFFNTLNTISSLMYDKPQVADKLIGRLSTFLRKAINLRDRPFQSLGDEIELLEEYREIMLERYPGKLEINFSIEEDCRSFHVPVLLLQPLLENAIKYSIGHQDKTIITLTGHLNGRKLCLKLEDNGPGIIDGSLSEGTGLDNTMDRLHTCYGMNHRLEIENRQGGGLLITIEIPEEK